jgi:glycerol kinase
MKAVDQNAWWLALDQGGHASRALVFDAQGQLIAQAFAPIQTYTNGDRVEHDALDISQSLRTCIQQIAVQLGNNCARIAAAGLATQRSSVVCWHRTTGVALSPVLSWQDRRQAEWLKTYAEHEALIQRTTGLVLSPHYGASKLRWCLDHLPQVQQALIDNQLRFGPLSSYLLHALLIEQPFCVDPSNASRTLLWSPATGEWSDELLDLFDIERETLPRCVPTRHAYGKVQVGTVQVPLRVCTGDQAAVPYAGGALRFDSIYLNIGTGAFALAPLDHDIPDAAPLLRSVLWSDTTRTVYALEGTVNGAAAALAWYAQQIGVAVTTLAEPLTDTLPVSASVPIFINAIGGVGSPFWLPSMRTHFVPEQSPDKAIANAQVAAIVESIAFLIAANLNAMRARLPHALQLRVSGGLSQCRYLCQNLASLCGLPVTVLPEPESTARGLAFLIADSPHQWPAQQSGDALSFTPRPNAGLQQRHRAWLQIMQGIT